MNLDGVYEQIYKLESMWYDGNHPLANAAELQNLTAKHKRKLEQIRKYWRPKYELLGSAFCGSFSMDQTFNNRVNDELKREFYKQAILDSKNCTFDMKIFAKGIIEDSLKLVREAHGEHPCSFGVLLFGSLGRVIEGTPYSDIEFGFIVENDNHNSYFEKLAMDIYFRIGNLAESPLKLFHIPELFKFRLLFGHSSDTMWFKDSSVCGFRFDGISPKSGNIPTGNGLSRESLILTPNQMLTKYKCCFDKFSSKRKLNGDISDLMASMDLLYVSDSVGNRLYQEFIRERNNYETSIAGSEQVNEKRVQTLLRDLEEYKLTPTHSLRADLRRIQVKSDIFRFITLLCLNVKLGLVEYHDVESADEMLWRLREDGWIRSDEAYESLMFILTSALWCRTSAYLQSKTQSDLVSLLPKYKPESQLNDDFHIPMQLYIPSMYMLIQVKESMKGQTKTPPGSCIKEENIIDFIRSTLQKFEGIKTDKVLLLCNLYQACGDSENALKTINREVTGGDVEKRSPEDFIVDIQTLIDRQMDSNEPEKYSKWGTVQMVAHLLFRLSKYEIAEKYFLYGSNQPGLSPQLKAAYQGYSGLCLIMLNRPMESYVHFLNVNFELHQQLGVRNILEAMKIICNPTSKSTKYDTLIALSGTFIGKFGMEILGYHKGNKSIHSCSCETFTKVLNIVEHYFTVINDGVHRIVADIAVGVGVNSEIFGNYHDANRLYRKAERIFEEVQGKNAASLETAEMAVYQARVQIKFGLYSDAKEMCLRAQEKFDLLRVPSPSHKLDCGLVLIEAYLCLSDHLNAHICLSHCWNLAGQIYDGNTGILDRCKLGFLHTRLLLSIGRAWWAKEIGESTYSKLTHYIGLNSISFLESSRMPENVPETVLEWLRNILPEEPYISSHPMLCEARQILADVYTMLNMFDDAEAVLNINLSERGFDKAFGKDSKHPMIAKTLFSYAKLEQRRGKNRGAQLLCEKAIAIMVEKFTPLEQQAHQELHKYQNFYYQLGGSQIGLNEITYRVNLRNSKSVFWRF